MNLSFKCRICEKFFKKEQDLLNHELKKRIDTSNYWIKKVGTTNSKERKSLHKAVLHCNAHNELYKIDSTPPDIDPSKSLSKFCGPLLFATTGDTVCWTIETGITA